MADKDVKKRKDAHEAEESSSTKEAKSEKPDTTKEAVAEAARISAQKVMPFLWFNQDAEEAMSFYASVFDNSMVDSIFRYPSGSTEPHLAGMGGKVLTGSFHLAGQQFLCLDGGPMFKFNPSISFFVNCATEQEGDRIWAKLSAGGSILMEFKEYPSFKLAAFNKKFGWTSDKYGVNWQISVHPRKQKITPFMMFVGPNHGKAEEAIKFYTSLFPNSEIQEIQHWGAGEEPEVEGTIKHGRFQICGNEYAVMESKQPHEHNFNEAVSLTVDCKDQAEVDFFWSKLSAHPDSENCGWLKDKYGVSWQITPTAFTRVMRDSDQVKSQRVMQAVMKMKKFDIAAITSAFEGEAVAK